MKLFDLVLIIISVKQVKSNILDAQNAENQALIGYESKIDEVVGGSGGSSFTNLDTSKTNSEAA